MQDVYIVRFTNNRLACFYHGSAEEKNSAICLRQMVQGRWSKPAALVENALPNFTLSLSPQGDVYIFCQDTTGSILLLSRTGQDGQWQRRTILENQSETVHTILFHAFHRDNSMSLIYNIPAEDRTYKLINQTLSDGGGWAKPQQIDAFVPMREKLFYLQYISPQHAIAFYKADLKDNSIGYREIAPGKWGNYNPIHQTAYTIADTSFLTTADAIHALYIVKSMFSSQLIYKQKETGSFTPPVVICESPKMENCLLTIVHNEIHAAFMINNQPYFSVSKNNGISFSAPELYKNKFCLSPIKATYISQEPMTEDAYFCREVYVDSYNPWDIQLLPELYEDFLQTAPRMSPGREPMAASISLGNGGSTAEQGNGDLYRKIETLLKENTEKDEQLSYMSNMLRDRGRRLEEANEAGEKLKAAYSKKLSELAAQTEKLERENSRLLEEIKLLSIRTTQPAPAIEPIVLQSGPDPLSIPGQLQIEPISNGPPPTEKTEISMEEAKSAPPEETEDPIS